MVIIIIIITILSILYYLRITLVYHPLHSVPEKYQKFYKKISLLTESESNISKTFTKTSDGHFLDTIYIKNPESRHCIIYFHGNYGNISMRFEMVKYLYNYASVIFFDYRSFGNSTGSKYKLNAKCLRRDAKAIWQYACDLGFEGNMISLLGESLGCAVTIMLAAHLSIKMKAENYPHAVILNAPFYSLSAMANHFLSKYNCKKIGDILTPYIKEYESSRLIKFINHRTIIVIAHSLKDEIIPYSQGVQLYEETLKYRKNIHFIPVNGSHNDMNLTDEYIYLLARIFL